MKNSHEGFGDPECARQRMSMRSIGRRVRIGGRTAFALSFAVLLIPMGASCQTPDNEPRTSAQRISRLSTTISVPLRAGGTQKLLVEIDDWRFAPGEAQMTMPTSGTGIMTVENGTISVRVAGASKTYNTGDYWAVSPETQLTISVQRPIRGAMVRTILAIPTA